MDGSQAFKSYREKSGYSIRKYASAAGISVRSLEYYENGSRSLLSMPTEKAILLFSLLSVSIPNFFGEYYNIELSSVNDAVLAWKAKDLRVYSFSLIKKRMKARLYKMRARGRLADTDLRDIFDMYVSSFDVLEETYSENDNLSDEDYDKYIAPIFIKLKKLLYNEPGTEQLDVLYNALISCKYLTHSADLIDKDFCDLVGVSRQYLTSILNGGNDINKLRIETSLRLCQVLPIDFEQLFCV